jgi:hypothetical protein
VKKLYRLLFALHLFVGIGAVAGGLAAILNPQEPLGVPVEALKNSPFSSFLIPGIILFAVLGLGNITAALVILRKSGFVGYISSVFSWALVVWIIVQCIMLRTVQFLHVLFFIIGAIQAALSAVVLFQKRLFPAGLILNFYNRIKREV